MTDAEKMLQLMAEMGRETKIQMKKQANDAATALRMLYESYIDAGFSEEQALELIKTIVAGVFGGGQV